MTDDRQNRGEKLVRNQDKNLSTLAIATAREVFDLLQDDLVAIEQELGRDAASSVSTITEIAEYLREGGGKRIRPSLLLLAAHMTGGLRLLALEFFAWRDWQLSLLAAAAGVSIVAGLAFLLNVV